MTHSSYQIADRIAGVQAELANAEATLLIAQRESAEALLAGKISDEALRARQDIQRLNDVLVGLRLLHRQQERAELSRAPC